MAKKKHQESAATESAPVGAPGATTDPRVAAIASDKTLTDGKPHIVRAVNYKGTLYTPGMEDQLKDAKLEKADIERLTNKGAIIGF